MWELLFAFLHSQHMHMTASLFTVKFKILYLHAHLLYSGVMDILRSVIWQKMTTFSYVHCPTQI